MMPRHEGEFFFEGAAGQFDAAYPDGFIPTHLLYAKALPSGLLGVARPPCKRWGWNNLEPTHPPPKSIRLPDNQIIATVGLLDKEGSHRVVRIPSGDRQVH